MADHASLCMLSYERPAFLGQAIETAVANAGAPLELIVHDDGSSDPGVRALLDDLLNMGLVSTVILNPRGHNQGQGTALNRMFNMATGDPIIKLDQDLIFRPSWLVDVCDILDRNARDCTSKVPLYPGSKDGIEGGPRIGLLGLFHYHHDPVDSAKTRVAAHGYWEQHTHICGSGFAVTRECWRALGPFGEHSAAFAEDWVFQMRVTESSRYVCALPPGDLVDNQGFGIGPSTVVIAKDTVQPIHMHPHIIGG